MSISKKYFNFVKLIFWKLLLVALIACGNGSTVSSTDSDGTGELSFSIFWNNERNSSAVVSASTNDKAISNCGTENVAWIQCDVYEAPDTHLVQGPSWPCSDRAGRMEKVNKGDHRILVCLGLDQTGNLIYLARKDEISVAAGQVTNAGVIDARPFVTVLTEPADNSYDLPANSFDLSWEEVPNAYEYRVEVDKDPKFPNPVINTFTDQAFFRPNTLEPNTTYHWRVTPVDFFGNYGPPSQHYNFITIAGPAPCTFQISPTSRNFGYGGGDGTITVTASPANCTPNQWTAVSDAPSWLRITSGSNGSGNGAVRYHVEQYDGTSQQSGAISVAGQTFTVTQDPEPLPPNTRPRITFPCNSYGMECLSSPCIYAQAMNDNWYSFEVSDNETSLEDLDIRYEYNGDLLGTEISIIKDWGDAFDLGETIISISVPFVEDDGGGVRLLSSGNLTLTVSDGALRSSASCRLEIYTFPGP